jgi:hypothetical protein
MKTLKLSAGRPRSEIIASFKTASLALASHGHICEAPDLPYWHFLSQDERDKAAASGAAMPDGSYPVLTCDGDNSVDTAIHAVGRGSAGHDAIRKHIITRAKSLGCSAKIPDNWNPDGSLAAATTDDAFDVVDTAPAPSDDPTTPTSKVDPADTKVEAAIAELEAAYQAVVEAQGQDPDGTTDPNDVAVEAKLTALKPLIDELKAAQTVDSAKEPASGATDPTAKPATDGSEPAPPVVKLEVVNKDPQLSPIDDDGNVDPDAVCAWDGGCTHLASGHEDTEDGVNRGHCQMANCECPAFTSSHADPTFTPDTSGGDGGGPDNGGGDDQAPSTIGASGLDASRGRFAADATADAGASGDDQGSEVGEGDASEISLGMNLGASYTLIAIVEGVDTGETPNRFITPGALEWENGPWALMGLATATHDAGGMDQNDPAVLCGFTSSYERQPGPTAGTNIIIGHGNFLSNEDGDYFADILAQGGRLPCSGDVIVGKMIETTDSESPIDPDGGPNTTLTLESGQLVATTILPHSPAFSQCFIQLGDNIEPTMPPQQTDDQMPSVAASGLNVHWMTPNLCLPCGDMGDVLVAAGGPLKPPKSWFEDPGFYVGDGRMVKFEGQGAKGIISGYACPPTVTEDGEVYGYVAPWGVCHTGRKGCTVAPHSETGYIHFMRNPRVVETAEGDFVRTGCITANTGHADMDLAYRGAMDHYDNTAFQAADVVVGEDEFGIWYHGALRPNATEAQVRMLRASGISGDWRGISGNYELVAALAVNQPGFPIAVTEDGLPKSMVAAGSLDIYSLNHHDVSFEASERATEQFTFGAGPVGRFIRRIARRESLERISVLNVDVANDARQKIDALR